MTRPTPAGFAFDAFGTLFDYAAATPVLEGAVKDPRAFNAAWRARQLDYTPTGSRSSTSRQREEWSGGDLLELANAFSAPAGELRR